MTTVAVVAVVLGVALQVPRDALLKNGYWRAFVPVLVFITLRLLRLSLVRREREDQQARTPPPL